MMDNWNQIIGSHVVKIFRDIVHDWWGMDVYFYDKFGNYKSNGISFQNPLCSMMQSKTKSEKICRQLRKEYLTSISTPHKIIACKCHENLGVIIVPIIIKGEYIGSMMCSGMQVPTNNGHRERSITKLTRLGFNKTEIAQSYDKVRATDSQSVEIVLKFVRLVAEDVRVFCEALYEKANTRKEQTLFLDRKYNDKYHSIIGRSKSIKNVFSKLELIENSESPVLIEGETGTGKELIASAIHYNSVRKDKAFVIQNCSAFSDTILNSELFGHEKGSFTGAVLEKKGLFEIANGGTLFLDEIGDISLGVQGKLLRVLENGTFYRVGGTEEREINVRIITATNKDLSKMVEKNLFRKDLLYRINTLRIGMPPLRERRDDILPLFYFFLEHYADIRNVGKKELSSDLSELLLNHNWPGNVREIKNVVENLITMSGESKSIEPEHLPIEIMQADSIGLSVDDHNGDRKLQDVLKAMEKKLTIKALKKAKWNKTAASRELGIGRTSLNRRIEKYNINKESL